MELAHGLLVGEPVHVSGENVGLGDQIAFAAFADAVAVEFSGVQLRGHLLGKCIAQVGDYANLPFQCAVGLGIAFQRFGRDLQNRQTELTRWRVDALVSSG
jgi:hypothetical protein